MALAIRAEAKIKQSDLANLTKIVSYIDVFVLFAVCSVVISDAKAEYMQSNRKLNRFIFSFFILRYFFCSFSI